MKIVRVLSAYNKATETLVQEIELPIPLNTLKQILKAGEKDPNLYDAYPIDSEQFKTIIELAPEASKLNFSDFDVFYECYSI